MDSSDDPTFDELAAQILEAAHEEEFYSSDNYNQIPPQYQPQQQQQAIYESHRSSSPSIYDEEVEFEFQEPQNVYEQDYGDPVYSGISQSHSQLNYRTDTSQSQRQQSQIIAPTPRSTITSNLIQPSARYFDGDRQVHQASSAFKPLQQIQRPVPQTQPRQYYPSPPQPLPPIQRNSFPIPANGNMSRRKDEHLRPVGGISQFQVGPGGNYSNSIDQSRASNRARTNDTDSQQNKKAYAQNLDGHTPKTVSKPGLSKHQSIEEDYFDDDDGDFEQAMVSMERNAQDRLEPFLPSTQTRPQNVPSQNVNIGQRRDESRPESSSSKNMSNGSVKLRPVSNLPDMFRSLFKFGVFNAVQSTTFDRVSTSLFNYLGSKLTINFLHIYNTNENVVVSAPTGAGKTALFELAMLRLFSTSTASDSKVVYVAPTKSLCNERAADWKAKFGQLGLGWEVIELTGDSSNGMSNLKDVGSSRVIITTPEKWDSMTRKWFTHERVLAKIRLLCIDECHFVGMDTRGAVLEVIVSRFKTLSPNTRFIAVSATVPNIDDVAQWLGAETSSDEMNDEERPEARPKGPARVFKFGEEYRPCKLHKVVVSFYKKGNDFAFSSSLDYKVMDLIKSHASGKAVLIFCSTRKGCGQTATILKKEYDSLSLTSGRKNLPWPKPNRSVLKPNDKSLADLMESGIAFHHAGMDLHDRQLVERSFLDGSVSVVCATSTLAVGVNLPARMVIIKGTSTFVDGTNIEYGDLDMLQMMGRAGRPQFDTLGVAVIMTEKDLQKKYEALANSETMLESCLHKNLIEHINSEITLRTITSVESALEWLRSTFLFVRINKRPKYYALDNSTTSPKDRLEEVVVEAVKALVKSGVVDEGEDSLAPTELGNMMARFYLDHSTFTALQALPMKSSMRTLLECLAGCSEYSCIRFRLGEKKVYGEVNKTLKYPARQVTSPADKVLILIGAVLQGIPLSELKVDNSNPSTDVMLIWRHATRILRCMVDLALERRDGGVKTIYELLRSINARAWEGTPFILRQLEGIGEKGIKVLSERDIFTFADVYKSEPSRLELILNRNPPFGRKLVAQARSFPQFSLTLAAESEEVIDTGIKITLEVSAGLAVKDPSPTLKKGRDSFWASILLVTSDGEYIEFRRIKIDKLLAETKVYRVSAVLVKPSQRIIASISSEELAGSEVKVEYKPTSRAGAYPLPTIEQRKLSRQDDSGDEQKIVEGKTQAQKSQIDKSKLAPVFSKEKKLKEKSALPKARAVQSESESEIELKIPLRLPNGKLACNHTCQDKTSCRHMCCRDGVDSHSRKKSKLKIKNDESNEKNQSISHSTNATKKSSSKSDKVLDSLEQMPVFNFSRPKARKLSSGTSSRGVKLTRPDGGRTTAASFNLFDESDEDGDDLPTLEKAMEVSTSSRKKQTPVIQTIFKKVVQPAPSVGLKKTVEMDELDLDSDEAEAEADGEDQDDEEEVDQLDSSPSPSPPVPLALLSKPLKRSSSSKQVASIKRIKSSTSTDSRLEPNSTLFRENTPNSSPVLSSRPTAKYIEIEEEEVDELDESQEIQEVMEVEEKEEEKEAEVIKELTDDEADFDAWLSNVTVL